MCLFCKIVDGEIPSNKIDESEFALAFHDINPQAKTHALIIPKKHIESFQDVDTETMKQLTPFIQNVAKKLNLDEGGYRVVTNIGDLGGQEVKHLHFHIIGGEQLKWGNFT